MEDLARSVEEIIAGEPYRLVLSDPRKGASPYEKVTVSLRGEGYQLEQLTARQAFHQPLARGDLRAYLLRALGEQFRQLNAWSEAHTYALRISKQGKVLCSRKATAADAPVKRLTHDREKRTLLTAGEMIPPLVDMGVMTPEGAVIPAMRNKFRQINRFLEFVEDELKHRPQEEPMTVIDLCCGKSYLTFVLYHYLTVTKGIRVEMLGLDLKAEVIAKCEAAARKYGYEHLTFRALDIAAYEHPGSVDMVVALHACDTATDMVLFHALRWRARTVFCVPCCHHELNGQMIGGDYPILTRYGIVQERVAALMTDAVRANLLAFCGYRAQLLEFVDIEHTPKNILLRARRVGRQGERGALAEVEALMAQFSLRPALYALLAEAGMLGERKAEQDTAAQTSGEA